MFVDVQSGGTCGNTASGCGRLGVPTMFMGKAGRDGFGKFLRDDLLKDGVNTDHLMMDEDLFTCLVLAVVGADNDRRLFVWPPRDAAHHQLFPHEFPDSLIDEIGMVHTSGIMLRDEPAGSTIVDFMERCKAKGVPVSLDINIRIESRAMGQHFWDLVKRAVAASTVILGSSADEFCPLTGIADPEDAARSLATEDNIIVARNGARPVFLIAGKEEFHIPCFATEVVDTIGAGDTFDSGFLAASVLGYDPAAAVGWGSACAAYCLQRKGARNCPDRKQLEEFLLTASRI